MRRRTSVAIHAVLLVLLAAPLHYYLVNNDQRDERFAWRMFSPIRSEKCGAQFRLGPNRTALKASDTFHSAWVGLAQRGRQQIIEAMGKRLCKEFPEQELRIRVQCETRPGSTAQKKGALYDRTRETSDEDVELVTRGLFDYCETGAL
jgi:hypothetical protein